MKLAFRFTRNTLLYVFRIVLGCLIAWGFLAILGTDRREWALISVIIVSEPDFVNLRNNTVSRVVNTLSGCAIGMIFLLVAGVSFTSMMLGITAAILISTSFPKYPGSWKLAPVTVVIVMAPSIIVHTALHTALITALVRAEEVLIGCVVAFLLGLLFGRLQHRSRHV